MIDLGLWRAAIGLFNSACAAANSKRESAIAKPVCDTGSDQQLTSLDIVTSWLCIIFLVWMGNSAKDNVFASLKVAPVIVASSVTGSSAVMAVEAAVSSVSGVSVALSPSAMCAPVLCVVAFALAARRVRLSNDVEENPGPPPGTGNDKNSNGTKAVSDMAGVSECIKQLELSMQQKLDTILATMQTQADTMKRQEDMLKRQEDMISRFGKEQEQLKKAIEDLGSDVTETKVEVKTNQEAIRVLGVKQNDMFDIVAELESEIDRLEGYSRRNNIKLFGIPEEPVDKTENCAEAVLNVLNTYVPEMKWEPDVIERAHRLGTRNPQNPNPRPIIAKFQRWGDAMRLMQDREARTNMQTNGLRAAQDLTRRQSMRLRQLREEGKIGYYVSGKLRIKDDRRFGFDHGRDRSFASVLTNGTQRDTPPNQPTSALASGDVTGDSGNPFMSDSHPLTNTRPVTRSLSQKERGAAGGRGGGKMMNSTTSLYTPPRNRDGQK